MAKTKSTTAPIDEEAAAWAARRAANRKIAPRGWDVDEDCWFYRRRRPGDRSIDNAHSFTQGGKVYASTPEECRRIDGVYV